MLVTFYKCLNFQTLYKTQVRELREEAEEKSRQVMELEEERTSLTHQLQLAVGRADSEALACSIAEETVAELEKEKTVKELEIHDLVSRHTADITEKDTAFNAVSVIILKVFSCILTCHHYPPPSCNCNKHQKKDAALDALCLTSIVIFISHVNL